MTLLAPMKNQLVDPDIHVGAGQGWVRVQIPDADLAFSISPSRVMELARRLIEAGWDQR